jgi:transmembrane sensor
MENQRFEELLIKELAGELTPAERRELLDLLKADGELRREHVVLTEFWAQKQPDYADMQSTLDKIKAKIRWQESDRKTTPMEATGSGLDLPAIGTGGEARIRRLWRTWSVAAALALLLGGVGILYHNRSGREESEALSWQEKYTPRNVRSRMTLTDGSSVTLNSDSRLKYPANFAGPSREVYLTGEAYFTIQKDPEHPFIIHTNKMTIRVLGTSFNVRCYPDDDAMEATLIQGSIEVTFPDRPADKIILKPTDKLVIRNDVAGLIAGRREDRVDSLDRSGSREKALDSTASSGTDGAHTNYTLTGLTFYKNQRQTIVETSWMDNKLVFNGEELQEVARRMERWFGVSIVIDKDELKNMPFTGLFQNETIDRALYALQLSEKKLHYTRKDGVIHIY